VRIRVLDPIDPVTFRKDAPETLALKISTYMTSELKDFRALHK